MRLLLAEDDPIARSLAHDALVALGFEVTACADGDEAMRALDDRAYDILLTDMRMPRVDGLALFRHARELPSPPAVVVMTAYGDTEVAVRVMREGARDFLLKPFDLDELAARLRRVRADLLAAGRGGAVPGAVQDELPTLLLGESPAMTRLRERLEAAAKSDVPVLVTGEAGTGKELCAQLIHRRSRRAHRPFVQLDCAAVPEARFEAELLGDDRAQGRLAGADGGTLFLEEPGSLSPANQAWLMRALERSSFQPVGARRPARADVRVIAATQRDLRPDVDAGGFRRDLFLHLSVLELHAPPLRERRCDLPLLTSRFLEAAAARHGHPPPLLTPAAAAALATHAFPGNVRELRHALEGAVALSRGGPIRLEHLPEEIDRAEVPDDAPLHDPHEPLGQATERFERQYIQLTLKRMGGHKGRTAALLGISRKCLWQRLRGGQGEPPRSEE